ncbi:hypothetical protein EJ03DRAFT_362762 [Teratosphaeria nubilosa]|uniref:Phytanoyl-CoA dioxygenase family protein n=1 Tax=Teratosphaeria nubilosa TaxID=161662 RepID=A0A6G1LKW5_9PEZI|nr:hypothetical protein EJ03DRAFT_362762 [Teratosphaeria nubilosa]
MTRSSPEPISAAVAAAATAASLSALLGILYYLDIPSLLTQRLKSRQIESRLFSADETAKPSLAAFKLLTQQPTLKQTYPLAHSIQNRIPIYDCTTLPLSDEPSTTRLQNEWHHILLHGPGVFLLKSFFPASSLPTIDATNTAFTSIVTHEKSRSKSPKGDHFSPPGTNDRIWNAFSKHALTDPTSFIAYYSNPLFRLVSESWLGPAYRITAQVNIVNPGGEAQTCHRDYHLGFQTPEAVARWPKAMHIASQLLTLQGAVAHTDMPVESGPTRVLPFSQLFEEGYLASHDKDFTTYFLAHATTLPLTKGDALFFSPALFHAAGANTTTPPSTPRSANLLQISSAFGKPMERIDTVRIVETIWGGLREKFAREGWSREVEDLVWAVGEGYPFPTDLDWRAPEPGGRAPESEHGVLRRGLVGGWGVEEVVGVLRGMRRRRFA